eukprot:3746580-Ditylum_brightwellii.AAC.2
MEDAVKHKSESVSWKVFSKNHDFTIALNAMKKFSGKLVEAVNNHLLSYLKIVQKKKRVSEEDKWLMDTNPNTCNNRHTI